MVIVVSSDGKNALTVPRLPVPDEAYLQQFIHSNPTVIPVNEIKDGAKLFVLAREFWTDAGPIDVIGLDSDGTIYIIETKLFKNPDKRRVITQALDYGAALWARAVDFSEFRVPLDKASAERSREGLEHELGVYFGVPEEEAEAILERMRSNLRNGVFTFLILMDTLTQRLKDLVRFLNTNSAFSIFLMETQFYRHDQNEITHIQLFGTEADKHVTPPDPAPRGRWDRTRFFEHTRTTLTEAEVSVLEQVYEWAARETKPDWGTSVSVGSFNPKFRDLSTRAPFTVYSDGHLWLKLAWVSETETARHFGERLNEELRAAGLPLDEQVGPDRTLPLPVWREWASTLTDVTSRVASEVRRELEVGSSETRG